MVIPQFGMINYDIVGPLKITSGDLVYFYLEYFKFPFYFLESLHKVGHLREEEYF